MKKNIQDINWIICKSCKYFVQLDKKIDVGICKKFSPTLSKDKKTFIHIQVNNIFSRINQDLCGPNAKYYEKNDSNIK